MEAWNRIELAGLGWAGLGLWCFSLFAPCITAFCTIGSTLQNNYQNNGVSNMLPINAHRRGHPPFCYIKFEPRTSNRSLGPIAFLLACLPACPILGSLSCWKIYACETLCANPYIEPHPPWMTPPSRSHAHGLHSIFLMPAHLRAALITARTRSRQAASAGPGGEDRGGRRSRGRRGSWPARAAFRSPAAASRPCADAP